MKRMNETMGLGPSSETIRINTKLSKVFECLNYHAQGVVACH